MAYDHTQTIKAYKDGWKIRLTLSGKIVEYPVFNTKVAYEVVPDDEGWRPWYPTKDSKCPVEPECTVVYEMNIGTTYTAVAGTLDWSNLDWTNMGDYHIIRYKAVADDVAPEPEYDICISTQRQGTCEGHSSGISATSYDEHSTHLNRIAARDMVLEQLEAVPAEEQDTKEVKMLAYLATYQGGSMEIKYFTEDATDIHPTFKRVPAEDKVVWVIE